MFKKYIYISSLVFIAALSLNKHANAIEIIIDKGVEKPIPVAIVPFGWSQAAALPPVDIAQVISNDLARSGRFSSMEEKDMPQRPTDFDGVNFRDWRLLGMENLLIGNLTLNDQGDYDVEFRLIDIYKEKQIAGFRIPSTQLLLRRTAHEISDIIYEKLIGIRGAFATRIIYVTVNKNQDGTKRFSLQISDADGFNPQILLESNEPIMSPAWSPDGRSLAYVSFEEKNSAVYIQDIQSGVRQKVASNRGINSAPAWSPDGSRLALTLSKDGNPEVYIFHIASKTLSRITENAAIDTEPAWSRDGRMLAFTSDRGGNPQIYEVPVEGGQSKRISFNGIYNAGPEYSPDNKTIAVINGEKGAYRIGLLDRATGQVTILTDTRQDESPSFAPNGHIIIYTTTGARGNALAAISVDGSVHQRLALQDGEVREPAWGPFMNR